MFGSEDDDIKMDSDILGGLDDDDDAIDVGESGGLFGEDDVDLNDPFADSVLDDDFDDADKEE